MASRDVGSFIPLQRIGQTDMAMAGAMGRETDSRRVVVVLVLRTCSTAFPCFQ